ncbi:hypothetical protein EV204_105199 [Tissierella praeacuta]|uniref:zinc ribbon domain-containing protein n=1 Tax=Tissierella praeacuta TaxID=43131 RepID=UPI00104D38F0|nr:zinc ribbon domain-containing protein [Tissierella praeacuta]TCU72863.1 hypothetical protein EV204_105199 [Tissierella praeacuta]
MALISCPECSKEISDKAKNCPNCGYPLEEKNDVIETEEIDIAEDNDTSEVELTSANEKIEEKSPKNNSAITLVLIILVVAGMMILGVKKSKEEAKLEEIRKEIASKSKSTSSYSSTTSTNVPTTKEKRESFASSIKESLNAPGLPIMCERAYFNDLGEFIIEVNGEWIILDDELKEDMIYALKELLKEKKSDLGVEGYGQFFSTSGKGLESFYAK